MTRQSVFYKVRSMHSTSSSSSSSETLHTPLLTTAIEEGGASSSSSLPSYPQSSSTTSLLLHLSVFFIGSVIGLVSCWMGFHLHNTLHNWSIIVYSTVWSIVTSIVALGTYICLEHTFAINSAANEYMFALGVFLGFCGACTVADVVLGMPWTSVLGTMGVAMLWGVIMWYAYWKSSMEEKKQQQEDNKEQTVVLPLVTGV